MGGDATFSGTTYQAAVLAFVYVHMLREAKLRWVNTVDDTPSAVAGEVRGPGDDARIELSSAAEPLEVQVKHGLIGQKALAQVIDTMHKASAPSDPFAIVLVVDSSSSKSIRIDFRRDLDRVRSGRTDELGSVALGLISDLGEESLPILRRLYVVTVDVDSPSDRESTKALELLEEELEDPSKVEAAWAVLRDDAGQVCARRLRRDRKGLAEILSAADIDLPP